jgi:ATP-dependent RNA helicase SUPV3L1/SUV3
VVGRLDGFRFVPDAAESDEAARQLVAAARRVLADEIAARVGALVGAADDALALEPDGGIVWRGTVIARLVRGPGLLTPGIDVLPSDLVTPTLRERIRVRLTLWSARALERRLPALFAARRAELAGPLRGLIYQLTEALGTLPRAAVEPQLAALAAEDRKRLGALGVRLGVESVFMQPLLKPAAIAFRALLFAVWRGLPPPRLADPARPSQKCDKALPAALYEAAGFRVLGGRAVRPDALERFAHALRQLAKAGPFLPTAALGSAAGCPAGELVGLIEALGYRPTAIDGQLVFGARRRPQRERPARPAREPGESPFAKLREHRLARR